MSEVLLENEISRFGLRRLHVVGPRRVARDGWLARLPETAFDSLTVVDYEEKEVGVWHLELCWMAREFVPLKMADQVVDGVMWWVGQAYGQEDRPATLREAADLAASTWWLGRQSWPGRCLAQKLPKGASAEVEVGWGWFEEGKGPRVKLEEAGWVPKGFVVVL